MKFIKFGAPAWCASCVNLDNAMKGWHPEVQSVVQSVDIDKDMATAKPFRIKSMPTLVVLDDSDVEIARYAGSKITEDVIRSHMV